MERTYCWRHLRHQYHPAITRLQDILMQQWYKCHGSKQSFSDWISGRLQEMELISGTICSSGQEPETIEFMLLGGKKTLILWFCYKWTAIKWFPMTLAYGSTHRSVPHSILIKDASSCSKWGLTLRQQLNKCREWETLEHSILNGISSSNPPLKAQGSIWKKRQNDCKSQRGQMTARKPYFPYRTGLMHIWTHRDCESIYIAQIKASWNPSTAKLKWTWDPTFTKKLSAADTRWLRKSHWLY